MEILTFFAGGSAWALPLAVVHEIVSGVAIVPLPLLPETYPGVISLRGTAVPAVDVGRLAGADSSAARSTAVITESGSGTMALLIEAIGDLVEAEIEQPDGDQFSWTAGRVGESLVIDTARVLEEDR